jgi:hypothetical protein
MRDSGILLSIPFLVNDTKAILVEKVAKIKFA